MTTDRWTNLISVRGTELSAWDTEMYGRAGGKETIVIDASLVPVKD